MSVVTTTSAGPTCLDGHLPDRPSWTCAACGRQWPSQSAQADLLAACRFDLLVAVHTMVDARIDAIHDGVTGDTVWPRFVGWARRAYLANARPRSA